MTLLVVKVVFVLLFISHSYLTFPSQVGLLYEEKILPLGKEITAVGFCNLRNGIPEIKSCKDLPYFLYVNLTAKIAFLY